VHLAPPPPHNLHRRFVCALPPTLPACRGTTFSSIVVAAGGWAGGGVGSAGDDAAAAALVSSTEAMLRVCLQPALVAGALAPHVLAPGGLLVLTGSAAAVAPTPGMLGYGMAKVRLCWCQAALERRLWCVAPASAPGNLRDALCTRSHAPRFSRAPPHPPAAGCDAPPGGQPGGAGQRAAGWRQRGGGGAHRD
jgi:hypothetical protein